jgi:hypothetical protein
MIILNILGAGPAVVIPGTAYLDRDEDGFFVIAALRSTENNAVGPLILVRTPSREVGKMNVGLFNAGEVAEDDDESLDDVSDEVNHCKRHKKHKHRHSS